MAARASQSSGVTAELLYRDVVWPALWKVLQLTSPPSNSANVGEKAGGGAAEHVLCARGLQRAITQALVQLLRTACVDAATSSMKGVPSGVMQEVVSHLLLHPHGTEQTTAPQIVPEAQMGVLDSATASPAAAAAAVEVERLYLLVCAAIQLSAQVNAPQLAAAKIVPTAATGAASETTANTAAAPQLPWGVAQASKSVVAGIFALSSYVNSSSTSLPSPMVLCLTPSVLGPPPSPMATTTSQQQLQLNVQHLWFTFLCVYLQQLSSHTPKDTTAYARFFAGCGDECRKRLATAPVLSDDDDSGDDGAVAVGAVMRQSTAANETAALQAWSHVSIDLLRDTIARTRFRRAALLFKSFVPHMLTQAPTVTFLLADVLNEFVRSWTAFISRIPAGCMADDMARRLARYDTRGMLHDDGPARPSQQWQQCVDLLRVYSDRLTRILGTGTPHGHLVATTLCAVLSALYVLPHTRGSSPFSSAGEAGAVVAGAAVGARGKRDEEAAVLEMETAHRQPRRLSTFSTAGAAAAPSVVGESLMSEVEWRLRHYAPLGQLLASTRILGLQKVHLFAVATGQLRVGRSVAQQVEHTRMLALAALYCGVAGWDLTVLMYHFAECPLNPFSGPETPPPALPISALARYTAAVQQYVEHTRAELIMDMPFTELCVHNGHVDGRGGRSSGSRFRGMRCGGGVYGQPPKQGSLPHSSASAIPSRGELHTRRFLRIVHPDPLLLNWRLHLTATEALVATTAVPNGASAAAFGGGSSSIAAAASSTNSAAGNANSGSAVPDLLLSPCCLMRDIIVSGQYALAADGMRYLAKPPTPPVASAGDVSTGVQSVNVLLLPRRAYPQHISVAYYVSILLRRWLQRWEVAEQEQQAGQAEAAALMQLRDESFRVLSSFLPVLSVVQSYMANQSLLVRLLTRLSWMCRTTAVAAAATAAATPASEAATTSSNSGVAPPAPNAVFALAERLLLAFVMPCIRVLPPAPMVYDVMEDVLRVFARSSIPDAQAHGAVPYGENAAMPLHMFDWLQELLPSVKFVAVYRTKQQLLQLEGRQGWPPSPLVHPHDALLRREREALLSHSLKRLNAENLDEYRALLRPILYAEPLLVAHRLFTQAVGYNNSFLDIHTRLLRGLPGAVLMLVVQQGLVLMARYAAEEKVTGANGECRVTILATFVATLWRDNLDAVDGVLLARRVELALRSNSGDDILLGTELCKALLAVMAHRALEHEEKYNPAQLQALAYTPSTTSLFGRGSMTSFRVRYWKDTASSAQLLLSPEDVFVRARQALLTALQQPCLVPIQGDEDSEDTEEEHARQSVTAARSEVRLHLGQQILLHLCRLQSRIYELQRDLDGGAEVILLSSAGRYNTINDMLVAIEEVSPPPTESQVLEYLCACVRQVALPHVASLIETQQRRKFEWASAFSSNGGAVPSDAVYSVPAPTSSRVAVAAVDTPELPPIAQLLQYFTAAHFEYKPDPYDTARYEWQQCMEQARSLTNQYLKGNRSAGAVSARRAASIVTWLDGEAKRIDAEESMHMHLYSSSAAARAALLELIRRELAPPTEPLASEADDRLVELAASYLLPRAVLNLREAATVAAFFTWLFQEATPTTGSAATAGRGEAEQTPWSLHCRAVDLALTFVTAAFTYFVGFTDGECKRLGCVLQSLLQIPALSAHGQQLDAAARLWPSLLKCIQALSPRTKPSGGAPAAAGEGARVLSDKDVAAAAVAGTSPTCEAGAAALGGRPAVSSGGIRTVSTAVFEGFLHSAHASLINGNDASSSERAGPASLLNLAMARGIVASPAQSNELQPAASTAADAAAGTLSAVPLQLEAYLSRAMIQLLTHEQDVPAYAHRNLFLVLEHLDKSTFPATLCAVDLLTRAVEPHASKTKSYYALASAVLKLLRANRRHRRELQHAIAALRHGDEGVAPAALQAARGEDGSALPQVRAAATACHGRWRLDEHYMRQLLQNEVAALLEDAQVRHRVDDGSGEDEEYEEGTDDNEVENDVADGISCSSGDGQGDNEEGVCDDLSAATTAQDSGEEDEEIDDSGGGEDASGSGSEDDDEEERDDGSDEDESAGSGDGDDASPAARKRRLEE
ncbi:transmembrane protein, conserved [Leishmania donovani]|uniref:Transmembrane protein, conserved n=1 Tax=Leishmania donovani TaxID=5661 RepID=A0A3S7WW09_LEIDO|nr:transmembrane protein, conserved [Leishmania donovani]